MYHPEAERELRRNIVVHFWDAGFYGLGIGLASLVTVLPLFVHQLGATNLLVGLVAAMHPLGWHLPQLFTVQRTARARRLLPVTQRFAFVERWPFLALAALAWLAPRMEPRLVLALTFGLVFLFGVGGGLTAPPFQTMVGKIVPPANRGAFYGMKAGSANLLASLGAVAAGLLLAGLAWSWNFVACFLAAFVAMMISWGLLALTREHDAPPAGGVADGRAFWHSLGGILRRDANLRVLMVARSLSMFALMAQGFITVYVVGRFGASPATVGLMTGVFMVSQTVANPVLGWLGDRWRHRSVMALGALLSAAAALVALIAPSAGWFFVVFAMIGVAAVALVITPLAMILDYSPVAERPAYIGLSNTLVTPAAILAPLVGGWLADNVGYSATFIGAILGGLATALVLMTYLRDPVHGTQPIVPVPGEFI
jgi:MFS family permease